MVDGHSWESETLHLDSDEFYRALILEMEGAGKSIEMEVYTFEDGILADRLVACFQRAVQRGVRVRLICDHWGSPLIGDRLHRRLDEIGVMVHVYRSLPWRPLFFQKSGNKTEFLSRLANLWRTLLRLNRGFHRKVTIIDGHSAWVSSLNVTDVHLREIHGEQAWRDIGVRLQGREVLLLSYAFERTFFRRSRPRNKSLEKHGLVNLNDSFWLRRKMNHLLKKRIRTATARVWIQNPYFLPERSLFRALCVQARRGKDVRIMIPEKSDQEVIRWMNYGILVKLLKCGATVWLFQPAFAHKKVLLIDESVSIGSTNLNHRSFLHDLEVEVILSQPSSKEAMHASFIEDQALSQPLSLEELEHKPLWFKFFNRILFFFRYWC
jgi:cardiolipin synthase